MARCGIEVELLDGARMRCEITAGHPGPHMNGFRGLEPGNITWEWHRLSAGNSQVEKVQITHNCDEFCDGCEPERSDGRIQEARAFIEAQRSDRRILCVKEPGCVGVVVLIPYCERHDPRTGYGGVPRSQQ